MEGEKYNKTSQPKINATTNSIYFVFHDFETDFSEMTVWLIGTSDRLYLPIGLVKYSNPLSPKLFIIFLDLRIKASLLTLH
jgi:hypothetical protein